MPGKIRWGYEPKSQTGWIYGVAWIGKKAIAKAGECRILLTKQLTVSFGGITDFCMISDTEYRTVKAFIYKEARLADESCYAEWEALWDDDAVYWVASVINW